MKFLHQEFGYVFVIGMALSLIYFFPIIASGDKLGIQDWDFNFSSAEFTRTSIIDHMQFPFWNPYKCGGSPHFASPESSVISITTILVLLFGTVSGIKISVFVYGFMGFIGFYVLARQYKISSPGSLLAAILFSFSGITGSFLSSGMFAFVNYAYTPYILYFFNKSIDNPRWVGASAIIFAISFYSGYHIPLLLGVYLIVYTVSWSFLMRSVKLIWSLVLFCPIAVFLMLPKLLVSLPLVFTFARTITMRSGLRIPDMLFYLFWPIQPMENPVYQGFSYMVDENSLYIGFLALALIGMYFFACRKKSRLQTILATTGGVMMLLILGNSIFPSLFAILHRLPIFSFFRAAQRFRFDLIIPVALFAGLGLDTVIARTFVRHRHGISVVVILMIYADLLVFSQFHFLTKTFTVENRNVSTAYQRDFVQIVHDGTPKGVRGRTEKQKAPTVISNTYLPWSHEYVNMLQNRGVVECYDATTSSRYAKGADDPAYRGEYYLANPVDGVEPILTHWSPNMLIYIIRNTDLARNKTLVVNQNYYPGWYVRTNMHACTPAADYHGLLSANLDKFDDIVTFTFSPYAIGPFGCN